MEKSVEQIQTYALPYLVNGDNTNLNQQEINEIDTILKTRKIELVCPMSDSVEGGIQPYFSRFPMFGKPTEVEDCIVITR